MVAAVGAEEGWCTGIMVYAGHRTAVIVTMMGNAVEREGEARC